MISYIDFIKLDYSLFISYKVFKNGNCQFKAVLNISDSIKYDQIQKNLLSDYFVHWQHFFDVYNIKLTKKQNLSYQISNVFPASLVVRLEKLGFLVVENNYYTRRKWVQYQYTSNDIFEINNVLFNILQHDLYAEKIISNSDLFA